MEAQTCACLLNVKFLTTNSTRNAAYIIFYHQYNIDVIKWRIWQVVKHWHHSCWLSICLSISRFSSASIYQNNNTNNLKLNMITVHRFLSTPCDKGHPEYPRCERSVWESASSSLAWLKVTRRLCETKRQQMPSSTQRQWDVTSSVVALRRRILNKELNRRQYLPGNGEGGLSCHIKTEKKGIAFESLKA